MKKILALLLTLTLLFGLAACASTASSSQTPDSAATPDSSTEAPDSEASPSGETESAGQDGEDAGSTDAPDGSAEAPDSGFTTVTPGVLTVATSPDFAPYEFYAIAEDGTPTLAGFDMALAQYLADYMGLELEVIPMDFDGVLLELAAGTVDLGMAGLSPDPTRMDSMDFSDIYYTGGQSFVCLTANKDLFSSLEDANDAGISVGAQTGSIQLDLAMAHTPDASIVSLPKVTDIIAELLTGKLDGAFIETDVAVSYQKNYPDLYIALDVPYDVAGSAIGVSKGNAALLAKVNEAIAACLADGSMDDFVAQANVQASGNIIEGLVE